MWIEIPPVVVVVGAVPVIPHVGMWIEIIAVIILYHRIGGHPSRRDVD